MEQHNRQITTPFDAVALDYDAVFTHSATGRLLRERGWTLITKTLDGNIGLHALELNCGTGEDAVWLAGSGWKVFATDISPAMIAATRKKADAAGLGHNITTAVRAIEDPLPAASFDLILSNFGGLNCLAPEALRRLNDALLPLLTADGRFIAVVMSRFCSWETLFFLWKRKPREAFRRLLRGPVAAALSPDMVVPTWYYSPAQFRQLFPGFRVQMLQPVGFWLPPSYLNAFFEKHPRFLRILNWLERYCTAGWLAPSGDHFYICLTIK